MYRLHVCRVIYIMYVCTYVYIHIYVYASGTWAEEPECPRGSAMADPENSLGSMPRLGIGLACTGELLLLVGSRVESPVSDRLSALPWPFAPEPTTVVYG